MKLFQVGADITAGQQFLGTEFRAQSPSRKALKLQELNLAMGVESKTWRIIKRDRTGAQTALIAQSVNSSGVPAATTDESVIVNGAEFETLLLPGEQIQIITSGASSAMRARLYFVESDFEI